MRSRGFIGADRGRLIVETRGQGRNVKEKGRRGKEGHSKVATSVLPREAPTFADRHEWPLSCSFGGINETSLFENRADIDYP